MRARRGQAVVESAIGLFVFLVILVLGIQGAEVGYLALKVQEAANAALWDTTVGRKHDIRRDNDSRWNLYVRNLARAEGEVGDLYADFDGIRKLKSTGQVFSTVSDLAVNCRPLERRDGLPTPAMAGEHAPRARAALRRAFPTDDRDFSFGAFGQGAMCQTEALIGAVRLPDAFGLKGLSFERYQVRACGIGMRAGIGAGGTCGRGVPILLDDYGFAGAAEARECALSRENRGRCENQPYYDMAKSVFDARMPSDGPSRLAELVAGRSPIREEQFFMSFRGSESQYSEELPTHEGDQSWETSPFMYTADQNEKTYAAPRGSCWLGNVCSSRQ